MNHAEPAEVELLVLDVDGVLTDGSIYLNDDGRETKRFNVRDGFGLRLWMRLGWRVAIITGRSGQSLRHRARELGIDLIVQGSTDKAEAIRELSRRTSIDPRRMAFVGDDWPDLPALHAVGFPVAVADADPAVLTCAAFVTQRPGGHGAVREVVEHLILRKGLMPKAREMYPTGTA
ncbi:MAG: KdsC family phosphatase [Phycisphaerales bacterium]